MYTIWCDEISYLYKFIRFLARRYNKYKWLNSRGICNYSVIFTEKLPRMQTVYEYDKLKSHDKSMTTLCVCCGVSKSTCKLHKMRFIWKKNQQSNPRWIQTSEKKEIFLRRLTSGEQFKKNFYCSITCISQRKWPSSYECCRSSAMLPWKKKFLYSFFLGDLVFSVLDKYHLNLVMVFDLAFQWNVNINYQNLRMCRKCRAFMSTYFFLPPFCGVFIWTINQPIRLNSYTVSFTFYLLKNCRVAWVSFSFLVRHSTKKMNNVHDCLSLDV